MRLRLEEVTYPYEKLSWFASNCQFAPYSTLRLVSSAPA